MKQFWNERYAEEGFAYGHHPNEFLKEIIDKYSLTGSIFFPAEGEGRNAVYAAKKGLKACACDLSEEGKKKALTLAAQEKVTIDYTVGDIDHLELPTESYHHAGLVYAHFPPNKRLDYHKKIANSIKPNGYLILEGFSKKHIDYQKRYPKVGGPQNIDLLFDINDILTDFKNFKPLIAEEKEVDLNEGKYHVGKAHVVRFVGIKK